MGDLPGLKNEEVIKVEVEDGWVLQISGERSKIAGKGERQVASG